MREVIVPKPKNNSLIAQLISLYETFKNSADGENLKFDLSKIDWAFPLLILPLGAYINSTKSTYSTDGPIKSYLEAVNFPDGISSVSTFQKEIQSRKNFIPVSALLKDKGSDRERLESLFSDMIHKVLDSVPGTSNAVYYPITELITNIFEHSKQKSGFIFGQFYPKKNHLDICIADRGRGFAATYKEELGLSLSDSEAIVRVMKGKSTKPSKERGYGVRTSKRVVCEGMNGEFILLSGSSTLVSSKTSERLVSLPGFYWQGVIVAYRIPKPEKAVDISKYLE
jgi:hypothetical protein